MYPTRLNIHIHICFHEAGNDDDDIAGNIEGGRYFMHMVVMHDEDGCIYTHACTRSTDDVASGRIEGNIHALQACMFMFVCAHMPITGLTTCHMKIWNLVQKKKGPQMHTPIYTSSCMQTHRQA